MTSDRAPARSPWTALAVLGVGGLVLLAGCLGGTVSQEPTLEVDRPADPGEDCPEVEVLRQTLNFAPRIFPVVDHGATWPIELRAGEAVKVSITGTSYGGTQSLPDLRMADPEGALLLDKDEYSSNHHRVSVETNGTHEITIENQYLTKTAEWVVEIHWYPDIECA